MEYNEWEDTVEKIEKEIGFAGNYEKFKLFKKFIECRKPYGHSWDYGELYDIWRDGWNNAIKELNLKYAFK